MASSMKRTDSAPKTPDRGRRSPIRLLILRGSHTSTDIGSSDTRIWSELEARRYDCVLLLQSRKGASESHQGNLRTVVSFVPSIPLLSWLLLNVIIILRFGNARFDLVVSTPRTWLATSVLRWLGVASRSIMDVRSGPVHRWKLVRLLEHAELKIAFAFLRSDGLTFLNERTKASLVANSLEIPIGTWGSGVDLDLFRPSKSGQDMARRHLSLGDAEVVMYHGSITEDRGVLQLIRAMETLDKQGAGAKLMLLGWGPELSRIRKKFGHLIESQVLLIKKAVTYEKVPAVIEASNLGALPLPRRAKWETQMPLKLLEYLAMGKMVVATDMKAHRGFGEGVILLPDNSPETLAAGLERVFRMSESERAERARDSYRHVEALSWKKQARGLEEFIGRVMAE